MKAELRKLSIMDGEVLYRMALEIGPSEYGFVNGLYVDTFEEFQEKVQQYINMSQGKNLGPDMVPQTVYWLYIDGEPVGYGKLRHELNDELRSYGGHIRFVIRPSCRGKGYGKIFMGELLKEAKRKKIGLVLITCDQDNLASRRVIEANYGVLSELKDGVCKYWMRT
ncbi:GNAT family N-acetyltransferase [Marinicrinis lubricantis]|uniref:GNAT family N-acetyltransferase n=1 Tax=Marinicrinis lubricantis TaxID=2086470 RepID=A0ABW1INN9_9BACL